MNKTDKKYAGISNYTLMRLTHYYIGVVTDDAGTGLHVIPVLRAGGRRVLCSSYYTRTHSDNLCTNPPLVLKAPVTTHPLLRVPHEGTLLAMIFDFRYRKFFFSLYSILK